MPGDLGHVEPGQQIAFEGPARAGVEAVGAGRDQDAGGREVRLRGEPGKHGTSVGVALGVVDQQCQAAAGGGGQGSQRVSDGGGEPAGGRRGRRREDGQVFWGRVPSLTIRRAEGEG